MFSTKWRSIWKVTTTIGDALMFHWTMKDGPLLVINEVMSFAPYKRPYKWVTGNPVTLISEVMTLLITGKQDPSVHLHPFSLRPRVHQHPFDSQTLFHGSTNSPRGSTWSRQQRFWGKGDGLTEFFYFINAWKWCSKAAKIYTSSECPMCGVGFFDLFKGGNSDEALICSNASDL